jgi:hypothetical protein
MSAPDISPDHQGVIDSFKALLAEAEGQEREELHQAYLRWLKSVGLQDYEGQLDDAK